MAHLKAQIDKTGNIQPLIDEKGKFPLRYQREFINNSLDCYINQVYRSIKCFRDRNLLASKLEAAESINPLLHCIFALHGRLCPYYKYLKWELDKYPLKMIPWNGKELMERISLILNKGDIIAQQEVLKMSERLFRKKGYNKVFDSWEGKDKWAMNYKII